MDGAQLAFLDEGSPERAATSPDIGHPAQFSEAVTRATSAPIGETEPASDGWGWYNEEGEADIVLEEQRRIAVYRNRVNGIVLREESPDGEREDHFIVLRDNEAAKVLIARLQREIGVKVR